MRAPLEYDYVVIADVASFYFFVDHQILEQRIVDSTAQADTAEALRSLLAAVLNRPYGLPQNFWASDVLADLYISWVQRRLQRAGIPTFRHNDDFRLGAASFGAGLQALERLQEELNAVGLDLNGEKSWILLRENYEANLDLHGKIVEEALPDEGGLVSIDPYTGEPRDDEPQEDVSDEEAERIAAAVFEHATTRLLSDERLTGFEVRAHRDLLNTALWYFRKSQSFAALELGPNLVAVDPSFAQAYAGYLDALTPSDTATETSVRILEVLERFRGHAPYWVQAWLIEPLLAPAADLSDDAAAWLRELLASRAPAVLRARAALGLAVHRKLDAAAVIAIFDAMPAAAKPDLVAALAFVEPEQTQSVKAVVESGHLFHWIFDYATEHSDDCRWA